MRWFKNNYPSAMNQLSFGNKRPLRLYTKLTSGDKRMPYFDSTES